VKQEKLMKGAEAYVNDQWQSCGLADLPQDPGAHTVILHFIVPRDAQMPGLITHIGEIAQRHLSDFYDGRAVSRKPATGSVVGDGSGDGINLEFEIAAAR